jgi:ABC-type multidrug transport system fused ATPase/permease subunit
MNKIFKLFNSSQKKQFITTLFFLTILALIELITFSFLQPIIAYFTNNSNVNDFFITKNVFFLKNATIYLVLLIFFIFFLSRSFLTVFISYRKNNLIRDINNYLSNKIFSFYLKQDLNFFLKKESSKMISNIILEIQKFSYHLIEALLTLITESFIILAILIFLFLNYFQGTIILGGIVMSFFYFFYTLIKKKFKKYGQEKSFYDSAKINDLQNSFYAIKIIKLEHLEDFFSSRFKKNTELASDKQFFLSIMSEVPKPLVEFLVLIIVMSILGIFYFLLHIEKKEIVVMLGLFVISMFRLLPSSNKVVGTLNTIKYFSSTVSIISSELDVLKNFKIYEKKSEKDLVFNNFIKLENINFSYDFNKKNILKNINLIIKKNETIGILGENGSGKSTLLDIISSLIKPDSGKVLVDNIPVEQMLYSYQSKIGYVSQKTFLTDESLIKNIIFAKDSSYYDKNKFDKVIETANLNSFINNLPQGKDTLLGERGSQLSGGELQKIAIARALYKNPEILLLDEATSALDIDSENEILKTIEKLNKKLTIVIVTHKKNILKYCDQIYILKDQNLHKS